MEYAMKKKIAIIAIVAAMVTAGVYFGIGHLGGSGVPVLAEGFGIWESEVQINNLYPGYTGTVPLTIINGNDKDRIFSVSMELANPDKLANGYECMPEEYFKWFTIVGWNGTQTIPQPEVMLKAGEYHHVTVVVSVPNNAECWGEHMEVRVRVSDITSSGLVSLAIDSRWYIIIADEY
jgi:hypothetical protein